MELNAGLRALDRRLEALGSLLVAFSGGVDSALLAVRAHQLLGARALAVTADSPSLADAQRGRARALAAQFGFAHELLPTAELDDPLYARNDLDRCYHCKRTLFAALGPLAQARGLRQVAYGLILDDLREHLPGRRAALEAGARAPLAEAGLGKAEVRALRAPAGPADLGPAGLALPGLAPAPRHAGQRGGAAPGGAGRSGPPGPGPARAARAPLGRRARVELAPDELRALGSRAERARGGRRARGRLRGGRDRPARLSPAAAAA